MFLYAGATLATSNILVILSEVALTSFLKEFIKDIISKMYHSKEMMIMFMTNSAILLGTAEGLS